MRMQRTGGARYFVCSSSGEFCARVQARVCVFLEGNKCWWWKIICYNLHWCLPSRQTPRNNSAVNTNTDGTVHLTDRPTGRPAGRLASTITVYAGALILCEL